MLRAIEKGLSLSDFEKLTFGMITGFITTYSNEHLTDEERGEAVRQATQADFDQF